LNLSEFEFDQQRYRDFKQAMDKLENDHCFEIVVTSVNQGAAVYFPLALINLALESDRDKQVALITPWERPGTLVYWQVLEHNYFAPLTPRNDALHFMFARFRDLIFNMAVIPRADQDALALVADQTDMVVRAQPTYMSLGGERLRFPIAGPNVFWLENRLDRGPQLHYQASIHALDKLAKGEYTLDQVDAQVKDAERVLYQQEIAKLRQFWQERGIRK
jgi:hypothetical protein